MQCSFVTTMGLHLTLLCVCVCVCVCVRVCVVREMGVGICTSTYIFTYTSHHLQSFRAVYHYVTLTSKVNTQTLEGADN